MQGVHIYQTIEKEEELGLLQSEKGQQQVPQSGQNRIRVALALVVVVLISGCVIFQAGEFTAAKLRSNAAFKAAAVVSPGSPMFNGDELWSSASDPKYKMVFINGDIWLYASQDCSDKQAWAMTYTDIMNPVVNKNKKTWGTPYWKFSTAVKNYITAKPNPGSNTKFSNAGQYKSDSGQGVIFNAAVGNVNVGLSAASPYKWTDYVMAVAGGTNTISVPAMTYTTGTKTQANTKMTAFDSTNAYGWITIYSGTTAVFQFRTFSSVVTNQKDIKFIIGTDGNLMLLGGANTMFFTGKYIAASGAQAARTEYFY